MGLESSLRPPGRPKKHRAEAAGEGAVRAADQRETTDRANITF